MNPKETLNKVKVLLGLEVSLEQAKLDNGTVLEAESFESGQDIFIVSEDERVSVPVGEYQMEDGKMLIITEEGVIGDIKEAEPEMEEEKVEEPEMSAEPAAPKKMVESISKELFFSEIEKLRKEITELKSQKEEVKEVEEGKEVELAEEVKPIKHNPEAKPERDLKLYSNKRKMTTRDRVFNKLFNN